MTRIAVIGNMDHIEKLHADARAFMLSQGFDFEGDFKETHDKEVIKFKILTGNKKIKCWLKCCYPEKVNSQGFCITFGAFSNMMPAQITQAFWTDSNFQLKERERKAINEKLALGRQQAREREKHDQKVADDLADWCREKYQTASPTGSSPYFGRKCVDSSDIRFEIRQSYDEQGRITEETIALIPLRDINGQIRALEEIYPSKRKFHPETEPRDKNTLGKYAGCFFTFGKIEDGKRIQLSEGYATAASLFASNNHTSLMVVTRTNILNVAKAVHQKYPNSEIIICGDDDIETKGNPGRTDAIAAAKYINSNILTNQPKFRVVFPEFPKDKNLDEHGKAYTDFNDLMRTCGMEEVKRQINECPFIPDVLTEYPKLTCELPMKSKESAEDEMGDDAEDEGLQQAKTNARRWALIYRKPKKDIISVLCKRYSSLRDQADSIASNAIEWSKKHQTGSEATVNGIPKRITDMKSLDLRFAQLEAPGQPCVIIHTLDAQPISPNDFNKRLSGEVVLVDVDNKGQPKYVAVSTFCTGNTHKKIYRDIVFRNKVGADDVYNLFAGFGVQPKEGKCDRILAHIKEIICAGSETNAKALIQLLAWQIQNIGKPSRIVVVLKSKAQQVGKGCLLGDILAVIYGNSGFMTGDLGQVITRFNDTLRGKAFLFLDEALFTGDRKTADTIKSLATATMLAIETKGLPIVQMPCGVNLFLTTNHDDAAYVEEADARYWILEACPDRVGDTAYFRDLYAEIEGGGREAFMHYLLHLDVSNFIPARDVPKDNAFKEAMIRNSINPYDARKWLEECCRSEMILGYKPINESTFPWELWHMGQEYPNGIFNTAYTEWQKGVKSSVAPKLTPRNKFGELLTTAGLELRINGERRRTLPDPKECLEKVLGMIEKAGKK